MRAINIQWDTDGDKDAAEQLPEEIQIPVDVAPDDVSDYISDQTGFCHFGYDLVPDGHIQDFSIDAAWMLPDGFRWAGYVLTSTADLADVCRVLYGDCHYERVKRMQGVPYPCIALFLVSEKDPSQGFCLGRVGRLYKRWTEMFGDIEISAGPAARDAGIKIR